MSTRASTTDSAQAPSPAQWVPSLYFSEGLPYVLVNLMSVPMFKGLGASNEWIGVTTSLLSLPWAAKALWSPLVERSRTQRAWLLAMQGVLLLLFGLVPLALWSGAPLALVTLLFVPLAFASATHDVAIDGYYMEALDERRQALYVGIRSFTYKLSVLFGTGALVWLAGTFAGGDLAHGWALATASAALLFGLLFVYHLRALPRVEPAHARTTTTFARDLWGALTSYVRQPHAGAILAFVLLFRLGDALMLRMAQPFLMDPATVGGLGLSTEDVGLLYGTLGMIFSLAGGLLGGWLIARHGLRRTIWPLALTQNLLILGYVALAVWRPGVVVVACVNAFEHLAFGLGISAYSVFLMQTVQPAHRASHYALATSFMAIGWALPGLLSGYLQTAFGYPVFFGIAFLLSLPGLATLRFLPYRT